MQLTNADLSLKGNLLTITVDLSKEQGPSKSGKSTVIATSAGNKEIPESNGARIGLNIYRSRFA